MRRMGRRQQRHRPQPSLRVMARPEPVEVARTRLHTAEAAKDGGGTGSEATSRPRRPSQLLRRRSAAGKSCPEQPLGSIMPRIIIIMPRIQDSRYHRAIVAR